MRSSASAPLRSLAENETKSRRHAAEPAISRVLFGTEIPRRSFLWDARRRASRATYPGVERGGPPHPPIFGLAPGGVCRAAGVAARAGELLPHRFTLAVRERLRAPERRSALCCTFLGIAPPGNYPAPCPVELGLSSRPHGPATVSPTPSACLPWMTRACAEPIRRLAPGARITPTIPECARNLRTGSAARCGALR